MPYPENVTFLLDSDGDEYIPADGIPVRDIHTFLVKLFNVDTENNDIKTIWTQRYYFNHPNYLLYSFTKYDDDDFLFQNVNYYRRSRYHPTSMNWNRPIELAWNVYAETKTEKNDIWFDDISNKTLFTSFRFPNKFFDIPLSNDNRLRWDTFGNLQYVDLSNVDLSQMTSFDKLFALCSKLQKIDFNQKKVNTVCKKFIAMFSGCYNLTEIDLSWIQIPDDADLTSFDMKSMFFNCDSLSVLKIPYIKIPPKSGSNSIGIDTSEYIQTIYVKDEESANNIKNYFDNSYIWKDLIRTSGQIILQRA
ncbi:hypothetical protein M9Y10_013861 [Tritrichomonas musculus]|uniref:BspA family leucine-rich repeat surface protein n=1 Tax=Tritrichomonas musculus TaxID=1915356 RepID=A0ABR2KXZ2_9EUKA